MSEGVLFSRLLEGFIGGPRVSDSGGGGMRGATHPTIFFTPPPSPPPHTHTDTLKNEAAPHLKKISPPLKCEAPFHEMIPRKSTINNNLKSS